MIYINNVAYQLLAIPNSTQGLNGKTIAKSNLPDPGFNIDRMCSRISIGRSHLSSRLRQLMTSYFSCVSLNHSSVSNNLQSTTVSSSSSLSSILLQFYIHFEDKIFFYLQLCLSKLGQITYVYVSIFLIYITTFTVIQQTADTEKITKSS